MQDSHKARLLVRNDFDSCIPQKDKKIGAYVARLSSLRQQLTGTEFAINDRIFLNHLFGKLRKYPRFQTTIKFMEMQNPRPHIDTAIRRITVTEWQHDADEGNLTTNTSQQIAASHTVWVAVAKAVGATALIGNTVDGEEVEEKGEKESSKLYTLLQSGNGILAMKGQLRMRPRTGRRHVFLSFPYKNERLKPTTS